MLASAGTWKVRRVDRAETSSFIRTAWSDGSFRVLAESENSRRFLVSFGQAADFLIDFLKMEVAIDAGSFSQQSTQHLLFDQILPRILAHEGELVLHAAGVTVANEAILFMGSSGSGKSSLAAAMHNWGFRLLGDDAIVASTVNTGDARAIYRSLRLFPDSIAALVDSSAELTAVAAYTSKRNVAYADDSPSEETLPIRAVFILDSARSQDVVIAPLGAPEACMAFVEHSFWMDPTDLARTKRRMTKASALAVWVPAFHVAYPRDYSALPAVRDAIIAVLN